MTDSGTAVRSSRRIIVAAALALCLSMGGILWVLIEQNEALRTANYERSAIAPFQLRTHLGRSVFELERLAFSLPDASRDKAFLEFDIFMERLVSLETRPPYPDLLKDNLRERYDEIRSAVQPLADSVDILRDSEGDEAELAREISLGLSALDRDVAALASRLNQEMAEGRQAEADAVLFSIRALMAFLGFLFLVASVLTWMHVRNVNSLSQANKRLIRLTEELARAREVSERANLAKSRFLASMSHELRTPLNAIIGFSDLIRSGDRDVSSNKAKEYAEDINMSGTHLLTLVNSILDTSRVEEGSLTTELKPMAIGPVLDEVADMMAVSLRRKRITLNRSAEDPVLRQAKIEGNPDAIRQMVINLCSNAIKFSNTDSEIGLTLEKPWDGALSLSVWDRGIGIPEDVLPRLGNPFEQGRDPDKHVDPISLMPGVGLGLSITRGLIEQHGGSLSIESVEGEGSRFTLVFRLSDPDDPSGLAANLE